MNEQYIDLSDPNRKPTTDKRFSLLDSPESWDFLYGAGPSAPYISLSFEGDMPAWEQLKMKAVSHGTDPAAMLRYALYLLLEGPSKSAAARARLMAYREWSRTMPVRVNGVDDCYVPADLLGAFLADQEKKSKR